MLDTKEFRETIALISSLKVKNMIPMTVLNDILHNYEKNKPSLSEIFKTIDFQKISDFGTFVKSVEEVFAEEADAVKEAKSNPEIINYLVGKVMKKTKGRADPQQTLDLIKEKLKS